MKKIPLKSHHKFFGDSKDFGGQYTPEILRPALIELEKAYKKIFPSKAYQTELKDLLKHFVGRPTPLIYAKNASKILGNEIYLKFEGLANTGAHKINNAIGQVLLAKKMGKKKIIAETGAGQHGLATAAAAAKLGLSCEIYMGEIDIARQRPNVFNMELFGAKVISVASGTKTLKDAVNETLRVWSKESSETFYVLGSALGPYPYPDIVRDLQSIIGKEVRKQCKDYFSDLPDIMIACVGGGSNSIGFFTEFLNDKQVHLIGVEAGGIGKATGQNAARINKDMRTGIAQGYKSIFLQDKEGNLSPTHSISAGLDYAGIGPQLAYLASIGRIEFTSALDSEVIEALKFFAKHEGIIPALESSHALAEVINISKKTKNKKIIANISGRGDKDIFITAKAINPKDWEKFLTEEIKRIKNVRVKDEK
ncbi:tryptophan synthase subunit beta [Helicobacter cappadocius]|uniref:Tryptophan synthase beta chain n=1 Tax=Helicobacter cappadocius TaxID=3063998 RepID=A0AA90PJK5_9HELI|nr:MULTISPECIES: tryptophan synthase subunit beta [unclassified Helicobacter]MDO7252939.1 tryptophan synthase subunit beta [Helicobacter sp. faydin-H75]MDP2539071.1 tryptophan synthase subunit beta [Helicobacter sp. faydin-H76]